VVRINLEISKNFLILLPAEVKSENRTQAKSLRHYHEVLAEKGRQDIRKTAEQDQEPGYSKLSPVFGCKDMTEALEVEDVQSRGAEDSGQYAVPR